MAVTTGVDGDGVVPLRGPDLPELSFSGPEAAELAGISYRQLDHWARRSWVVPSGAPDGTSRRSYSAADVVRLAALGHLGRSRVDVAAYAEATGRLPVGAGSDYVVVWGVHDDSVRIAGSRELRRVACQPGRWVLFDPAPLVRAMGQRAAEEGPRPRRRTFGAEYKRAVLAEYDRISEPGAKSALLRREGLHTSHLVAWRRSRDTGELDGRRGAAFVGKPA